jgi:hypothetical protein
MDLGSRYIIIVYCLEERVIQADFFTVNPKFTTAYLNSNILLQDNENLNFKVNYCSLTQGKYNYTYIYLDLAYLFFQSVTSAQGQGPTAVQRIFEFASNSLKSSNQANVKMAMLKPTSVGDCRPRRRQNIFK